METYKKHTASEFKNLTDEQAESLAAHFSGQNAGIQKMGAEIAILQEVIYKLTGLDSIDATVKVFGEDIVESIVVSPEEC